MLTKRQVEVLDHLLKSEDGEIVCDGPHCMIDQENISRGTVRALLQAMAIKDSGYASAGVDVYIPTTTARHIVKRPDLAQEMLRRVIAGKPFSVDDNGVIQDVK